MKKVDCDNMDDETFKELARTVISWYETRPNKKLTEKEAMNLARNLLDIIENDIENDMDDSEFIPKDGNSGRKPIIIQKKKIFHVI